MSGGGLRRCRTGEGQAGPRATVTLRAHGKRATVTAVHPPGRFGALTMDAGGVVREFDEKHQVSAEMWSDGRAPWAVGDR